MIEERERNTALQERVNLFKDQGYRGFFLKGRRSKVENSIEVKAENQKGVTLSGQGDTIDEAYGSLIDRIDYLLDD